MCCLSHLLCSRQYMLVPSPAERQRALCLFTCLMFVHSYVTWAKFKNYLYNYPTYILFYKAEPVFQLIAVPLTSASTFTHYQLQLPHFENHLQLYPPYILFYKAEPVFQLIAVPLTSASTFMHYQLQLSPLNLEIICNCIQHIYFFI